MLNDNSWFWKKMFSALPLKGKFIGRMSICSVQLSRSAVSNSLWPHGWQHTKPPCPSPTPRVHPNPHPSRQWCHTTISSSVVPFFSHLQSFPASRYFQMSQFFTSGGESIGVSASALPMNTQDWSHQDGLVGSPCSPRDSRESSPTPHFKSINFSVLSFLYSTTLTSIGEGNGNPLQYSCLENPLDRGAW